MSEWRKVATKIIDQHYYPEVDDTDVRLEEAITDALTEAVAHLEREQAQDRAAIRALKAATEKLVFCAHACDAPCPHTRKYDAAMTFSLEVAATLARAQEEKG